MLLNENIIAEAKIIESDRTKLPEGVLCRIKYPICNVGKLNANKRRYGKNVWERVRSNKDIGEKMAKRALFGHAEHPASSQSDLQLTSHVIFEMAIDGNTVFQTFDVVDTPCGRIVDTLLRAQCQVGCSTRAEGELSEATDDDGNKCFDVIAESYKYITTDFTADPSTFGSIPLEIKRNVVSKVRSESVNEKATDGERKFATMLLESMKCKHDDKDHKCKGCGACGEKKVDEGVVRIVADPNQSTVNVSGDVGNVNIAPDAASTTRAGAVSVTVTTVSDQIAPDAVPPTVVAPPTQTVVGAPGFATTDELEGDERPEAKAAQDFENKLKSAIADQKSEEDEHKAHEESETPEEEEKEHEIDEAMADHIGAKTVDSDLEKGNLVVDKDKKNWVVTKFDGHMLVLKPAGGGAGHVRVLHGDGIKQAGIEKVRESRVNEGVIDAAPKCKKCGKSVLTPEQLEDMEKFATADSEFDAGEFSGGHWDAQFARLCTCDAKNESVVVNVNDLRVKEAVSRAELTRALEILESLTNKDLEAKIAVKKLKEMLGSENSEIDALRSKLEEKVKAASDLAKKFDEAKANLTSKEAEIKTLTERVASIDPLKEENTKAIDAMKAEHAAEVEALKAQNEKLITEKVNAAVIEASAKLIKEYAERQISGFNAVHDNVRALLERCASFTEVDKVVDEYRDSRRQSALHSKPLKEVVVQKVDEPLDPMMQTAKRVMDKMF